MSQYAFLVNIVTSPGQICTIEMTGDDLDMETVSLLPDQLWMRENVDMALYVIQDWVLE